MSDDPESRPNDVGLNESVIESVLKLPEILDAATDFAEVGIDSIFDNDVVTAIPVVKTLHALVRGARGYREAWLTKKLAMMLYGVGNVTAKDVERWRRRIADDAASTETGERVLAVIDSVTSLLKATLVGNAFRAYLDGGCDRVTFRRTCEMINAALTEDLVFLLEGRSEGDEAAACGRLVAVGLMTDRAARLLLEGSQTPIPSPEGNVIRGSERRPWPA